MVEFDIVFQEPQVTVRFGETFVASEAFKALFQEGMGLVEAAAAYLDGPGREESQRLTRHAALGYASESMRLTTRLMQIASWLLVQRAVAEGEITPGQALQEKTRVRLAAGERSEAGRTPIDDLPPTLKDLIVTSRRLHARIQHLDGLIGDDRPTPEPRESPVTSQHDRLRSAFGGRD